MFTRSFILLFSLCLLNNTLHAEPRPFAPKEALEAARGNNEFAVHLLQQMPKEGNVSFSPYSISSVFAMAYTGAKGETQQEMSQTLRFPSSAETLDKGWEWLNRFITFYPSNSSEDIRVRAANSIWVQSNYPVLPTFKEMMNEYFNSSFRLVDFKNQSETARVTINSWVKQNTYGKITEILSSGSVTNATRMVMVSALYLKAKWLSQFDPHVTTQQPFFTDQDNTITTATMNQTGSFGYFDSAEASILEMPYAITRQDGPEFSMLIALPHDKESIHALESNLTIEKLQDWMKSLQHQKVIVSLPKFKVEQFSVLNEMLEKMGLAQAFDDQADFSGITGLKNLKISQALHKVYVNVDETGSEAAAATALTMMMTGSAYQQPPILFRADHPFLYFIYEKRTGIILFMGRVGNPNTGN